MRRISMRLQTSPRQKATTFFGRLRGDVRGNTLALMAAAMIPLIAMIGSGVDMTRAYMAQNRLRQACDAGSLAGRKLLAGTTITPAIRLETKKYFNFNFPPGFFQSATFEPTITAPATGTLHVEAQTTIPTTLMKMFGFPTLALTAACSATQDFVNTDIVMVFDLSGSMNCAPGGLGDCGGSEQPGSKIDALRDAAKSFYDTLKDAQDQLHDNSLRLRYGFVNYNSAVNVGRVLMAKNSDFMVQSALYQSRTPNWFDASGFLNGKSDCNNAWTRDGDVKYVNPNYTGVMGGWWLPGNRCSVIIQTNDNPDGYTYGQRTVDVRAFLTSTSDTPTPAWPVIGTNPPGRAIPYRAADDKPYDFNTVWKGCIEERQTDAAEIDGGTATAAPLTALDLDIDTLPTNDASRWRPMWPRVMYFRNGSQPADVCPTASQRLREFHNDKAGFTKYIDDLRVGGGTYHDLGIIWGARFISPTGIFKSPTPETNNQLDPDNPVKIRGFGVKKYMIFMTDGKMEPTTDAYSSYGIEQLDGRVMGGPSTDTAGLTRRHLQRFRMACNAAKSKNIDVWVIAFATTLTTDMEKCASKPEQASGLTTNAALIAKFEEIGSKIGSLRLSQ